MSHPRLSQLRRLRRRLRRPRVGISRPACALLALFGVALASCYDDAREVPATDGTATAQAGSAATPDPDGVAAGPSASERGVEADAARSDTRAAPTALGNAPEDSVERFRAALAGESWLSDDARAMRISLQGGMLRLNGRVASASEREWVLRRAESIAGKDMVIDQLEVMR